MQCLRFPRHYFYKFDFFPLNKPISRVFLCFVIFLIENWTNFSEFWKSEFPSSLRFAVLNCWRPHCVRPVFWEMCLNGRTLKNKPKNTTCLSLYGLSVLGTLLILSQTIYYSTLAFTSWLHRAYRSALSPYLGTSQVFSECFLSWACMWFSKLPSTHTCFWMPQHPKEPFPSLAFPPRF